ncbi:Paired amphipathic helix protein Sin3-like 3 [Platanthera guangdongensis]|uniref:Paired amphipathic helix protein Sin3-like 3 n=1 Tax=Platanthera guangdongensis TaxID=2320717 RepID=A0ABR2LFG0_9ASPA
MMFFLLSPLETGDLYFLTWSFEYIDRDIHNDLFQIIKYSCQEVCSSAEQLDKVVRIWTTFMEPMLGVFPRRAEETEDIAKSKGRAKTSVVNVAERNGSPGADASNVNAKSSNGETSIAREQANLSKARLANGDAMVLADENFHDSDRPIHRSDTPLHGRLQSNGPLAGEMSALTEHPVSTEFLMHSIAASASRANMDGVRATLKSGHTGAESVVEPLTINEALPPSEGGGTSRIILSINMGESNKAYHNHDGGGPQNEREEGELSPNVDFEEDNFVAFKDSAINASAKPKDASARKLYKIRSGEVEACGEAAGDNDADADDEGEESAHRSTEDSENASEAGEDVSGSESDEGEECSPEDHGEEDADHDDQDAKAESEGEADGIAEAHDTEGEITSLPFSERFLHTAKPLAKHVPVAVQQKELKWSRVFYGNDSFYVLFRFHQTLYERILSAKRNSAAAERKWRFMKDTNHPSLYSKFMTALYSLLDGSADNTKFEDDCRAIIGTQSYVLFTLDKLIYKVVKQLQSIASDDMDSKLLQLFWYEKSRRPGRMFDIVYHENARVLLHDECMYRFECSSNPNKLSIQLMDYGNEKPDVTAVSIEPNFSGYLYNDLLPIISDRNSNLDVFMRRNKRKFGSDDETSLHCKAMEGVQIFNGLECKIATFTSKVSYVLDTEDLLVRTGKRSVSLGARRCTWSRVLWFRAVRPSALTLTSNSGLQHLGFSEITTARIHGTYSPSLVILAAFSAKCDVSALSRPPSSAALTRSYSAPAAMPASTRQTNSLENTVASPSSYEDESMVPESSQFHCDYMNNSSKRPRASL